MAADQARRYVLVAWLALLGIQIANQATKAQADKSGKTMWFPKPNVLISGAFIYTVLGLAAEVVPGLAVAFAAGVDVAVLFGKSVGGSQAGNTLFDRVAQLSATLGAA